MNDATLDAQTIMAGLRDFPLARRGLVTGGLATGFTVLTTRVDAQAIHTDSQGLIAGDIQIATSDGHIPGYGARPDGSGLFPIVVVNEEVFGVHEYIKDVCRRLAKAGYVAVAPEIYAREGDISKATDYQDLVARFISKAPDARVMSDLDSAVAWAADNHGDAGRLGVTGFCRGGRTTWLYAAHNAKLRAAVAWYGPVATPDTPIQPRSAMDVAAEIRCPLLCLDGAKDTTAVLADVQAAAAKARAAGKTVDVVVYPDAGHGFHADYRPSYVAADAQDGWSRALAWFKKYGV
jgi:carboxymethylenebutenolidase